MYLLHVLILFFAAGPKISDYHGGSSPLTLILLSVFFCMLLLGGLFILFIHGYRLWKFNSICVRNKVTGEEVGHIKNHALRYKIPNLLELISNKKMYDHFVNNVATFYSRDTLSEEDFFKTIALYNDIRSKLGLLYNPMTYHINASRAMHLGQPVLASIMDDETNQAISFSTRIVEIHDLFLVILPPDEETELTFRYRKRKPDLEISFSRPHDTDYIFDSSLVRIIDKPHHRWYIAHGASLYSRKLQKNLDIPTKILCTQSENPDDALEFTSTLFELTNTGCMISHQDNSCVPDPETSVLLSFTLNDTPLTIRGRVNHSQQEHDLLVSNIAFSGLDEDNFRLINRFLYNEKKHAKQQRMREEEKQR